MNRLATSLLWVLAACGRHDFDPLRDAGSLSIDARTTDASPADLVVWLPFDDPPGTTMTDASGHGHDGTCSGFACPTFGVAGARGTALAFDGVANVVYVPYAADFELPVFTVALWSRHDSLTTTMQFQTLLGRQYGALDRDVFVVGYNLNAPHPYMYTLSTSATLDNQPIINGADSSPDLGTWVHVAVTYDGNVARMYRNGVVTATMTVGGAPRRDTTPITIGGSDNGGGAASQFFPGAIDDVRIYNRILSVAELTELAQPI